MDELKKSQKMKSTLLDLIKSKKFSSEKQIGLLSILNTIFEILNKRKNINQDYSEINHYISPLILNTEMYNFEEGV